MKTATLKLIAWFAFGCPTLVFAKSACSDSSLTSASLHEFPGAGYWMQPAGDCRVTYTSWGGLRSAMYNMCTRQSEPITGYIDAFPVPGGDDLYVHPERGISFYRMKDALQTRGMNSPIYSDRELNGDYQSVGLLPGSRGQTRKVRISMGSAGGWFRDYDVVRNGDNYAINPTSGVTRVCRNLASGGLDRETPILSRDGQMIAGREFDSRRTKIYKLSDDGSCAPVATIPSQTSKVSFSFDHKHVAYLIKDPRTQNGRLMDIDIDSGKIRTISGPTEDVTYMSYKPNGQLMYSRRLMPGRQEERSILVTLDPKNIPLSGSPEAKKFETLGQLWAKNCNSPLDADQASTVGARLDGEVCRHMTSDLTGDFNGVSKDTLSGLCGPVTAETQVMAISNR